MIEHELLIVTIETLWPQLIHGTDYLVAHPIDTKTGLQTGDAYIMRWEAAGLSEPDIKALLSQAEANRPVLMGRQARAMRATLLAGTDWTQLPDAALTAAQVTAYQAYRTALRDVPQQAGFPTTIKWPAVPA
jgi:Phage tail assembly chaperone protein